MRAMKRYLGPLLVSVSLAPASAFSEDFTIDRMIASQCAQCHGTNGKAVGRFESLTDESFKDLYEDLSDMRKEDRAENIMDHQALGYTQEQIYRIARYYGMLAGKAGEAPEIKKED